MKNFFRVAAFTLAGVLLFSMVQLGGSASAEPTDPVAPQASANITIGTHNVFRGKAAFKDFAGVIGWQEVNDPADRKKLRNSLPDHYNHYVPKITKPSRKGAKAVPISWNSKVFKLINAKSGRAHPGKAGETPARHVNLVILKHRKSGEKFTFINTHFVHGAWNGKVPNNKQRWITHSKFLRTVVNNHVKKDMPVFVVGDFNRHKYLKMKPNPVRVKGMGKKVPIDHVYQYGAKALKKTQKLARHGSDHHAYRTPIRLG